MKLQGISITFLLCSLSFSAISQNNFEWQKIIENLPHSKDQLFDKTSFWIADIYKDSKEVIQLKDEDNGKIITKGVVVVRVVYFTFEYTYYYRYSMNYYFKENRCKVEITDVYCDRAIRANYETYCVSPFSGEPTQNLHSAGTGISKKKAIEVMRELK